MSHYPLNPKFFEKTIYFLNSKCLMNFRNSLKISLSQNSLCSHNKQKTAAGTCAPLPVTNRVKASAFGGSDLIASWLRSSPQNGILSLIKMHFLICWFTTKSYICHCGAIHDCHIIVTRRFKEFVAITTNFQFKLVERKTGSSSLKVWH